MEWDMARSGRPLSINFKRLRSAWQPQGFFPYNDNR
jgi:hypothetical protein